MDESEIEMIRKSAISDFDLLDREYREAKKTGVISNELKEYLWKSRYLSQGAKKNKKHGQLKYSNAIVENKAVA